MKTITSKSIFLKTGLLLLINFFSIVVSAQKSKPDIINILKTQKVNIGAKGNYIAVLPINGCFNCIKQKEYELSQIKKEGLLIVYPSARKVVQESIKKDFQKRESATTFLFDDKLYSQLFDINNAKGYIVKLN